MKADNTSHLPSIHGLPNTYVMRVAEISTIHITKEDGARLLAGAPEVLATIEGGSGHILHFSDDADIEDDFRTYSPEFRALLIALQKAGFTYVRLDADGAICRDLPTFDW